MSAPEIDKLEATALRGYLDITRGERDEWARRAEAAEAERDRWKAIAEENTFPSYGEVVAERDRLAAEIKTIAVRIEGLEVQIDDAHAVRDTLQKIERAKADRLAARVEELEGICERTAETYPYEGRWCRAALDALPRTEETEITNPELGIPAPRS